jgi:hypothetical protein
MTRHANLGPPIPGKPHDKKPAANGLTAAPSRQVMWHEHADHQPFNWTLRSAKVPKYQVEEIDGHRVTATHIVNATTPIRAAREATGRDVTLRTSEPIWIRVTDEQRSHIFEYSFSL